MQAIMRQALAGGSSADEFSQAMDALTERRQPF